MTALLDSTLLINALRGEASGIATMRELLRNSHALSTSVINVGELYAGARPSELKAIAQLLGELEIYPVTFSIGKHAGELRNRAARKGRTLQLDDMLVAATALEFGLTLVTNNTKDFKETGVVLFSAGEN